MDETVFVILLLIGFCVPSASFPSVYYFVSERMTWNEAQDYCISEHIGVAQILDPEMLTTMMNTPTGSYTGKAWIGLYEHTSDWTWETGQPATYFSWGSGQPDNINASELCAYVTNSGTWHDSSCSEMKRVVCAGDGHQGSLTYFFGQEQMTWTDAKIYCENQSLILAIVPDERRNNQLQKDMTSLNRSEAWIGLSRPKFWYWTDTAETYTLMNWQEGQPDNLSGQENCAAVVVKDGTWTDEDCNATYPFFCYGVSKSWTTVVRMTIQSSANMEDPDFNDDLQRQLDAAFVHRGVPGVKLTWRKLPEKQTPKSSDDNRCFMTL